MMKLSTALIAGLMLTACEKAYADSYGYYTSTKEVRVAAKGPLTASNGMTLYIFDRDSAGTSNCNGDCADSWPPFYATSGAAAPSAEFTKVRRKDGKLQWAKNGAPLYFWIGDSKPGDTNGDGVGGVWHVAH